jgi:hypothetical protein
MKLGEPRVRYGLAFATKLRAHRLCPGQARLDTFSDQVALELSERREEVKQQPARRGRRVDLLVEHDEVNAERLELAAESPLELFEWLYATYRNTPREKILEFMANWPDVHELAKLSDEELLLTYVDRMVSATREPSVR